MTIDLRHYGHWCCFCQTYHSSMSCYHPSNRPEHLMTQDEKTDACIAQLEAKLAAAEARVRELEARWTEAWCPNCHAVIEQCPYCGYDTAPDCFVRDRARLTATEQEEES